YRCHDRCNKTNVTLLKRMRAVRADDELELKQELVCYKATSVVRSPILPAHLIEFARPVRQDEGLTRIVRQRIGQLIGFVKPQPREPAAPELVVARQVPA